MVEFWRGRYGGLTADHLFKRYNPIDDSGQPQWNPLDDSSSPQWLGQYLARARALVPGRTLDGIKRLAATAEFMICGAGEPPGGGTQNPAAKLRSAVASYSFDDGFKPEELFGALALGQIVQARAWRNSADEIPKLLADFDSDVRESSKKEFHPPFELKLRAHVLQGFVNLVADNGYEIAVSLGESTWKLLSELYGDVTTWNFIRLAEDNVKQVRNNRKYKPPDGDGRCRGMSEELSHKFSRFMADHGHELAVAAFEGGAAAAADAADAIGCGEALAQSPQPPRPGAVSLNAKRAAIERHRKTGEVRQRAERLYFSGEYKNPNAAAEALLPALVRFSKQVGAVAKTDPETGDPVHVLESDSGVETVKKWLYAARKRRGSPD